MNQIKVATLVREIGKVAQQVGNEYADQQAAFEAERKARIELFERAIELAKPALPAIANPVPWTDREAGWCGFPIVDEWGPDDEPWKADMRTRIYVAPDGTLFEASRYEKHGGPEPLLHAIDTDSVADRYEVGEMIAALHGAIVRQAGKRCRSAADAMTDARKLAAIVTLLDD
jgi:hypothetical protein